MNPESLTTLEWKLLSLVNEKGDLGITKETCCHEAYGRQTAVETVEDTLDELWTEGLVVNLGLYRDFRYFITDRGRHVLTHYYKPLKPLNLW